MDYPIEHWFVTKRGESVLVQPLDAAESGRLIAAYLGYEPRGCFQGLPPLKDEVCGDWARQLVESGVHWIAVTADGRVVGHLALLPVGDFRWEMLLVVWPSHQNVGIGTELVHCALAEPLRIEARRILLSVEATNLRARHVYEKTGFEYRSRRPARELTMAKPVVAVSIGDVLASSAEVL
jgi:RimJ/RimL family protein N-acetyltransferase